MKKIKPKHVAFGAGLATSALFLFFILKDFERSADAHARQVAERAANDHMALHYGLTQSRVRGMERLARALGV